MDAITQLVHSDAQESVETECTESFVYGDASSAHPVTSIGVTDNRTSDPAFDVTEHTFGYGDGERTFLAGTRTAAVFAGGAVGAAACAPFGPVAIACGAGGGWVATSAFDALVPEVPDPDWYRELEAIDYRRITNGGGSQLVPTTYAAPLTEDEWLVADYLKDTGQDPREVFEQLSG